MIVSSLVTSVLGRRRLAGAAVIVTAALAVVVPSAAVAAPPNGITSLPPEKVAPMVQRAAESARSVTLNESESDNAHATISAGRNVASDLFHLGAVTFAIRRIGDTMWFRPNDGYWHSIFGPRQAAKAIDVQHGQWLQATEGTFLYRTYRADMFPDALMRHVLSFPANLIRITGKSVDGRATYGITGKNTGDEVYAATHGTPYPLLILSHAGQRPSYTQRLAAWNVPITVAAPPSDNIITLQEFKREFNS